MGDLAADLTMLSENVCFCCRMDSNLNQDGVPRPSYVFSADPVERPSEINFDGIKLDLSHEFSLVASNTEVNKMQEKYFVIMIRRKCVHVTTVEIPKLLGLREHSISVTFSWTP